MLRLAPGRAPDPVGVEAAPGPEGAAAGSLQRVVDVAVGEGEPRRERLHEARVVGHAGGGEPVAPRLGALGAGRGRHVDHVAGRRRRPVPGEDHERAVLRGPVEPGRLLGGQHRQAGPEPGGQPELGRRAAPGERDEAGVAGRGRGERPRADAGGAAQDDDAARARGELRGEGGPGACVARGRRRSPEGRERRAGQHEAGRGREPQRLAGPRCVLDDAEPRQGAGPVDGGRHRDPEGGEHQPKQRRRGVAPPGVVVAAAQGHGELRVGLGPPRPGQQALLAELQVERRDDAGQPALGLGRRPPEERAGAPALVRGGLGPRPDRGQDALDLGHGGRAGLRPGLAQRPQVRPEGEAEDLEVGREAGVLHGAPRRISRGRHTRPPSSRASGRGRPARGARPGCCGRGSGRRSGSRAGR